MQPFLAKLVGPAYKKRLEVFISATATGAHTLPEAQSSASLPHACPPFSSASLSLSSKDHCGQLAGALPKAVRAQLSCLAPDDDDADGAADGEADELDDAGAAVRLGLAHSNAFLAKVRASHTTRELILWG